MEPALEENASMKALREANLRFLSNEECMETREKLVEGQDPFAVVVACSDSRSEPGKVFAVDLGHIFVIRNAGNVMEPVAIGSIEYAVSHLKTPLVVILGHTLCGAITATTKAIKTGSLPQEDDPELGNLAEILGKLQPSVETAMKIVGEDASESEVIERACRENATIQMKELVSRSEIVKERLKTDESFAVCSALYHLETGKVEWIEQIQGANMEKFLP
eukprot:TRINITY_DN1345_c0_g1_i3.p1 TRINITY_DN1345_c0_g1~~TRINITY_DN1345_c0_g1_i3.p1  ORF type:complete len:220 (+),score=74.12 TRINITY_DN1345_c0_g1_i3:394-1053(+)